MNIVLHIIWKDLRAVRWPLVMLALGLAALTVVWATHPFFGRMDASAGTMFLVVVLAGMAVALVAALVQEDNLISTAAFWRTRPMVRSRLLIAKLVVCGLVFVPAFAPLLIASAGHGNPPEIPKQLGLAACVMVFTAVVAALTRDLKQFLVGAVLAICAFALMLAFCSEIAQHNRLYRFRWATNQFDAALGLTGVLCLMPLTCQYLGTPRRLGIIMFLAAIVLGPLLSLM